MRKFILLALCLLAWTYAFAAPRYDIVPTPKHLTEAEGFFRLDKNTALVVEDAAFEEIAADFKAVMEPFGSVVRTGRGRQSQRGGSPRESGSPREKLQRQYEQKKSEIQTYENNLGFMNASSKSGNGFVDAIKSKIEELKKEADEILAQIRALDSEEDQN